MAPFLIERPSRLPVGAAWQRLTHWEAHAAHVPLTRIVVPTPHPPGVGTRIVARTGIGRVAFDDCMDVVRWQPPSATAPGRCRLEKQGSVVTGWAELEVRAHGAGSWVVWEEDLRVRGLPRLFDPLVSWSGRLVFGRVVSRLLDG
ncbi:SRPBCC family protein [Streptomyces netropsis]|uniref:SRPBCC family protein n=1 Tax=Streptomyces netropsis TaxID=55404 RepID=UPI0030CF3B65